MSLILDPDAYSEHLLAELVRTLIVDLTETQEMILSPRGRVLDPTGLDTARELFEATLAQVGRSGDRTRAELAAEANLAYAAMLAVIDLVKSHTDVPRVPARRGDPQVPPP
jgi:hypothetical protein